MIDTLMALWNRNSRKKILTVLFAFFLICISIPLLVPVVGSPALLKMRLRGSTQNTYKSITGAANLTATAPPGATAGVLLTPTAIVPRTVVTQAPTAAAAAPAVVPTATSTTPVCSTTPTNVTNAFGGSLAQPTIHPQLMAQRSESSGSISILTPMPTVISATPGARGTAVGSGSPTPVSTLISLPAVQRGGGPLPTGTSGQSGSTPAASPGGVGGTQQVGGGWIPNCAGDSIATGMNATIIVAVGHNLGGILESSLLGTILFYCAIYVVGRRRR